MLITYWYTDKCKDIAYSLLYTLNVIIETSLVLYVYANTDMIKASICSWPARWHMIMSAYFSIYWCYIYLQYMYLYWCFRPAYIGKYHPEIWISWHISIYLLCSHTEVQYCRYFFLALITISANNSCWHTYCYVNVRVLIAICCSDIALSVMMLFHTIYHRFVISIIRVLIKVHLQGISTFDNHAIALCLTI